jgi:uncharacterized protein (TIGR02145 family)
MNMRLRLSTPVLIALLLTVASCKKTPTEAKVELPILITGAVTSITSTGATVAGNVTDSGGATVTARGVCYATTQNPTTSGTCVASGSGAGTFSATITGLTSGTLYYVRAYATNSAGTEYGSQISFTTTSLASVTTGAVSNISGTGATVAGSVTATGGTTVTQRGVCYTTVSNSTSWSIPPTSTSGCLGTSGGTGEFSIPISTLNPATTYYVRAFAINAAGAALGNQVSFTTTSTVSLPTVTTGTVSNITSTSVTVSGNVTATGGATVTVRGVCYATTQNPTISGTCVASGSGTGTFTATITGLSSGTQFYVRAYATNSGGTTYGAQVNFATTVSASTSVTDIDGNVYPTVQIGTQLWMASNLKTTRYRNGATITKFFPHYMTAPYAAWENYGNDSALDAIYGKLYNWYAVVDSRKLCPTGWHVPSDSEWTVLSNFLDTDVGYKMKSTTGWADNGNGSNASGFNGLPGGWTNYDTETGLSQSRFRKGIFWSSTEYSVGGAIARGLSNNSNKLDVVKGTRRNGYSVRCVRD